MLYINNKIKRRKTKELKIRNIINIISYIIVVPLLIYNMILVAQAIKNPDKTPDFLGIKTYVIVSGSMEPILNIGDVIIVKNYKDEQPQKGDIISFRHGQSVITHRICEIINQNGETVYQTKGDNNNVEDIEIITYKQIEGKVVEAIPEIGKLILMLKNKTVIMIMVVFGYMYLLHNKSKRKRKEDEAQKKDMELKKVNENRK